MIRAVSGSSRIAVREDTDLPEPDSPTTASTSPGLTSNDTSSTADTGPLSVLNVTDNDRKESADEASTWLMPHPPGPQQGLMTSLRLSPTSVMPSTTRTMAIPGNTPVHQIPLATSDNALFRS